jgi:hypothetical protein
VAISGAWPQGQSNRGGLGRWLVSGGNVGQPGQDVF